jgi:hypothetical protein
MRRSVSILVVAAGLATIALAWAGDKVPDQAALADAREDVSQASCRDWPANKSSQLAHHSRDQTGPGEPQQLDRPPRADSPEASLRPAKDVD